MTTTITRPTSPVDPLGVDLTRTLRALKLGGMADTLPERLTLARQQHLGHAAARAARRRLIEWRLDVLARALGGPRARW